MEVCFEDVTKDYKTQRAVEGLNMTLEEGVYGLLGPNGAGKSTLMKMLVCSLKPTKGIITCNGEDIQKNGRRYLAKIGYMPQQQEMYPYFTGRYFLSYMAALKGLTGKEVPDMIEELGSMVNLQEVLDRRIGSYSGGMRQRLLIAQALLGDPDLLILDEPTAGLDPKERIRIRNLISEHARGKIVLIATHVVQDIEFIADEIIMMKQGVMVTKGKPENLLENIRGKVYEISISLEEVNSLLSKYRVSAVVRDGNRVRIRFLAESDVPEGARQMEPDMEDYYLYLYDESPYKEENACSI